MAFAIFALILIASLVIAILSKRGAVSSDMGDVMTAGGSFGAFLVFFISVGEIYSIGTVSYTHLIKNSSFVFFRRYPYIQLNRKPS